MRRKGGKEKGWEEEGKQEEGGGEERVCEGVVMKDVDHANQ